MLKRNGVNMKNYTISVCTFDIVSDKLTRLLESMDKYLDRNRYDLLIISGKNDHDFNLNMALDACKTPYIIFADDDIAYEERHSEMFDKLDEFWMDNRDRVATISFGESNADETVYVDESINTPYHNFCHCCYNLRAGLKFLDVWEGNQCNDVAWFRMLRYAGWQNRGAFFMSVPHFCNNQYSQQRKEQIVRNQLRIVDIFGCATDAAPEKSEQGWAPFERWLLNRYKCIPFKTRNETCG